MLGDQLAEGQGDERRVGRTLEHHGAARGERGSELRQRELVGVVVGDDRGDNARGFLLHPAVVLHAAALDVAEVLGHGKGLEEVGVVADDLDGLIQLGAGEQCRRGADLSRGERGEFVAVVDQRPVELFEAVDAQLDVGGPARRVERLARGGDCGLGIGDGALWGVPEDLAGGGVDGGKGRLRLDEFSVDQHAPVGGR